MEPLVLVINPGSSSREYAIYSKSGPLISGYYEHVGDSIQLTLQSDPATTSDVAMASFDKALNHFLDISSKQNIELSNIKAIGLRIVAPGRKFLRHQLLDNGLTQYLHDHKDEASLHISVALEQIEAVKEELPTLPIYAISDSAFHHSLSHEARNYAINSSDAHRHDVYRFGYHGLSVQSVVNSLASKQYERMIVLHLGSGASATAIKDGCSVDTSMGYSPLEGLVMATRSGNIDIEAALKLKGALGLDDAGLVDYLNKQSGLLGLSKSSNDIRELLKTEKTGDKDAELALSAMVYRIRSYIGAYHAVLGGLDALVFTGTVGERSYQVRNRVCNELSHLGIELNPETKRQTDTPNAQISDVNSRVDVFVIPSDEPGQIAAEVFALSSHA